VHHIGREVILYENVSGSEAEKIEGRNGRHGGP
jgi:hypothetical protein